MLFDLVAGIVLTIVFVVHPVIGNPRTFMEKQLGELFVEVFMFFSHIWQKVLEHLPSLGPVQQVLGFVRSSHTSFDYDWSVYKLFAVKV
jgi:hypothetical protein